MLRMSRVCLLAALALAPTLGLQPSLARGQATPSTADVKPAPGEPGGSSTAGSQDRDQPERFDRTPEAIPGTGPSPAEDATAGDATPGGTTAGADTFDVQAELLKLRRDFEARVTTLEQRLEQQMAALDNLQKSGQPAPEGGETTTANKPATADGDATAEGDAEPAAGPLDRDQEIRRLRQELDKLRTDYGELFIAVTDHTAAINNHAQGLSVHADELKQQGQSLTENSQQLKDLQAGQESLAGQLRDGALEGSGGASSPTVLGNMQASPQLRSELYDNLRYRLRIRNGSGQELPIAINGVPWTVRADEWTYVPVPYGPVTVQRPGHDPLEISEERIDWQRDSRGFFINYDYATNQVATPAAG